MAATRPSIMSEGATMSAPALAWATAVRASSARVGSFLTSPSGETRPQWPWEVYSHRQVSATTTSSGQRSLMRRMACWTMPFSA